MVDIPQILNDNWHHFTENGLTKTCVYQSMLDSEYAGGSVTKPIDASYPDIEMIFGSAQKFNTVLEDGSTIRSIDKVVTFPSLFLPVDPKINDFIVDPFSKKWKVKAIADDPADAHYELLVRPVN